MVALCRWLGSRWGAWRGRRSCGGRGGRRRCWIGIGRGCRDYLIATTNVKIIQLNWDFGAGIRIGIGIGIGIGGEDLGWERERGEWGGTIP